MSYHHIIGLSLKLALFATVIAVAVYLFNKWLKYKERSWAFLLKQDNNKSLAPLRISAYERIVIMLERITPQSLIMRLSAKAVTAGGLQMDLIKAIREEYEHNVSLQMYVSPETWGRVGRAKDETIELIKVAYTKVRPESSAMDLCRVVLALEAEVGNGSIKDALNAIRAEMSKYF